MRGSNSSNRKTNSSIINSGKAWVAAMNMGYGHKRAAFALRNLAVNGEIINVDNYPGIPKKDRKIWEKFRKFSEFISNFKSVPLLGGSIYEFQEQRQEILDFYPKRDLSKLNYQIKEYFSLIKRGWGKNFIEKLKEKPLPILSTFFAPVHMAEHFSYPGEIFCVVCDADISRTWAPVNPAASKIKYLAPSFRAAERLKLYGVKTENIFLTGFPLPLENIGTEKLEILKQDLSHRILNLDPQKRYFKKYQPLIEHHLGKLPKKSNHLLTIMFAVGGAGVQKEIGIEIARSLVEKIEAREVRLFLMAGTKEKIKEYFYQNLKTLNFDNYLNKGIEIIFEKEFKDYFKKFNRALRKTDILWTKPSELSFYTALGLPIIMSPTIGWQEKGNREWLLQLGSGIIQQSPQYANEWLFDLLNAGWFARAAMQGFIEGEKMGTFKIKEIICP